MNRRLFVRWLGLAPVAAPAVALAVSVPASAGGNSVVIDNVSGALVSVRARPEGAIRVTVNEKSRPAMPLVIGGMALLSTGTRRLRG